MRANRATALQGLLSCRHYYTNACNDAFFFITHPLAPSAREGGRKVGNSAREGEQKVGNSAREGERKVGNSAMNGGQNVGNSARDRKHCENARRAMSLRDLTKSNRGFASDSGLRSKCVASAKRTKQNPLNLNCLSIFGLCNDGRNSPSLAEGVRGWVKSYLATMAQKYALAILAFTLFLMPNLAKAEQSGWFVGIQGGYAKATAERLIDEMSVTKSRVEFRECLESWGRYCAGMPLNEIFQNNAGTIPYGGAKYSAMNVSQDYTGYNAGLLAGYKHFFSPKFGLRFYTLLDASFFKNDDSTFYSKFQAYNYTLNLDLLYNLIAKDDFSFGIFGGVGAGGIRYVSGGRGFDDINLGLNLGLRMNLSHHHGFEVYSRVSNDGVFKKFKDNTSTTYTLTYSSANWVNNATNGVYKNYRYNTLTAGQKHTDTFSQPYQIGIRYIYSF